MGSKSISVRTMYSDLYLPSDIESQAVNRGIILPPTTKNVPPANKSFTSLVLSSQIFLVTMKACKPGFTCPNPLCVHKNTAKRKKRVFYRQADFSRHLSQRQECMRFFQSTFSHVPVETSNGTNDNSVHGG